MALFSYNVWYPLSPFGLTSPVYGVHVQTLIYTWIAMALLCGSAIIARRYFFAIDGLVYTGIEYIVNAFAGMCVDSIGYFRRDYFNFVATLFLFTFSCCLVSVLPYMEEATKDVNTTFAIALISFFYVCYQQIVQEGILTFLEHFLGHPQMPLIVRIIMIPLETMGKLSKIISMAFRLFGNVIGGAVVYHLILGMLLLYKEQFVIAVLIGGAAWVVAFKIFRLSAASSLGNVINKCVQILFIITGIQMFFGVFDSLIQSFVIAMLSMTYLALSVKHDLHSDRKGIAWN
ncbi:MAG: F-type H+-transporting ATPase subunit a [Candidatus Dependentiae bacterium]|nr:F-type H+-transporting ATPase subunit a [Candidatus Dependentiae bacterium]